MRQAGLILEKFDVPHEVRDHVLVAEPRPGRRVRADRVRARAQGRRSARPGCPGHLAAAVAARTVLPVIGVPIAPPPQMVGNEALAITAQMPTGVPVATVGVDAAVNAAILAAEILGVGDAEVQARALEVQGRPGGGPQAVIPRYDAARDGRRVVRRGPAARTGSRSSSSRSRRWSELGVIPPKTPRVRERASFTVDAVHERRARHAPRRRRVRPAWPRSIGARGPMGPLRHDVLGRAGHGPRAAAARGGRPAARRSGAAARRS